jgi:LemA protein
MNLPLTAAIPAFFLGMLALAALRRTYRMLARLRRAVEEHWQMVETALNRREERVTALVQKARYVPSLAPLADRLKSTKEEAVSAGERDERIGAEQEISRILDSLAERAEAANVREGAGEYADLADILLEMQVREQQIAEAREKYNEAAVAWNTFRNAFPAGLVARSLAPKPAPLFEG